MIVKPKMRGFISLSAHPQGCEKQVEQAFGYFDAADKPQKANCFERVLVVGSSMGYGLLSRIAAASLYQAGTLGVMYERAGEGERTASAGWYNTLAFEKQAGARGLKSMTICGDAFDDCTKEKAAEQIKNNFGQIDLLIYSLAAPRKKRPDGSVASSVLKTCGQSFETLSLDLTNKTLKNIVIPAATQAEIDDTVEVMGGGDWYGWVKALRQKDLLSSKFTTLAYTYIGSPLTYPIYKQGSIGCAKEHLYATAKSLRTEYCLPASVVVNGAVVTQSSCAIPVVPLYLSALAKLNGGKCCAESAESTIKRLFQKEIECSASQWLIRLDQKEMDLEPQISKIFQELKDDTLNSLTDTGAFFKEFCQISGFQVEGVDYDRDNSIAEKGDIIVL